MIALLAACVEKCCSHPKILVRVDPAFPILSSSLKREKSAEIQICSKMNPECERQREEEAKQQRRRGRESCNDWKPSKRPHEDKLHLPCAFVSREIGSSATGNDGDRRRFLHILRKRAPVVLASAFGQSISAHHKKPIAFQADREHEGLKKRAR